MILGIGSDLVDVRRIEHVLERHGERFLARIFTATDTLQGSVNGTATIAVTTTAADGMTLVITDPSGNVVTTASAGSSYDLTVTALTTGGAVISAGPG